MYRSYEFSLRINPGEVMIYSDYGTEDEQSIILSAEQVPEFCRMLMQEADNANALQKELEEYEASTVGKRVPMVMPGAGDVDKE